MGGNVRTNWTRATYLIPGMGHQVMDYILMSYIWLKAETCGHVGNDSPHHFSFGVVRIKTVHSICPGKETISFSWLSTLKHRFCCLKSALNPWENSPCLVKTTINSPTPELSAKLSHLGGAGRPHVTPVAALAELQRSVTLLRHRFGKNIGCGRCFQSLNHYLYIPI